MVKIGFRENMIPQLLRYDKSPHEGKFAQKGKDFPRMKRHMHNRIAVAEHFGYHEWSVYLL